MDLYVTVSGTVYGKTFKGENFHGYKKKHLSLEKFCRLAVSAII